MVHIRVIGLGAMGASYAAKFQSVPQADIRVIAGGERAERLRRDGVTVNGQRYDFNVVTPGEPAEPADLLLVGVKYTGLAQALRQMGGQIGDHTIVVSLLNGITSEAEIAAAYPACHPLLSITVGVDAVRQGQEIHYANLGKICFGEKTNQAPYSESVRWFARLCDAAGLEYEIPSDMVKRQWWKFLVNTGVNQVTAILESPYAVVQQPGSPARELMLAAQREVVAVAQGMDVGLDSSDIDSWLDVLAGLGPAQFTSMAQDTIAHRPTETDIFSGSIVEMAARLGLAVPVNTCLYQILKAKELVWAQ